jgi:Na+/H+ antiporter NhaD/arsenite permease-like protein
MKRVFLAYLCIVLLGIAPLLVTIISASVAHALGCQVDEGSNHPCAIFGFDWGSAFYVLAVFGWFTIITLPLSALALIGLTIFLLVKKFRKDTAPF